MPRVRYTRKGKPDQRISMEPKVKVAKIRINDTEFEEFDKAAKELNMEKTIIIREAVKQYLEAKDIKIWNN